MTPVFVRVLSVALAALLVANLGFCVFGNLPWITFYFTAILTAAFAYFVLPKLQIR